MGEGVFKMVGLYVDLVVFNIGLYLGFGWLGVIKNDGLVIDLVFLIFLLNILFLFLSLDGENLNFGLYYVVIFFGFENKGILGLLGLGVLK